MATPPGQACRHELKTELTQLKFDGVAEDLLLHPEVIVFAGANFELRFRWKEEG